MKTSRAQPRPMSPPAGVRTHVPMPEHRLRAKQEPRVTKYGRGLHEDRKRIKETIPGSRRGAEMSNPQATTSYQHSDLKPIYMGAETMQNAPIEPPDCNDSQRPTAISTKLRFPSPPIQLLHGPTGAKITASHPVPSSRRPSYERRRGGPQFTIYEDRTATNQLAFSSSGYRLFPQDIAMAIARRGRAAHGEIDQENDTNSAQGPLTRAFVYTERAIPTGMFHGDTGTGQEGSRRGDNHVSDQATKVLRMMR